MNAIQQFTSVEQASDYLRFGGLRASADPLGWGQTTPHTSRGIEIKTVTSHTTTVLTVPPLTNDHPMGTTIVFEDGRSRVSILDQEAGDTTITLNQAIVADSATAMRIAIVYRGIEAPIPNPKYTYVVDEALRQMGFEHIESINAENMYEFRLRARVEMLRRVAEGNVASFDYITNYYGPTDDPATSQVPVYRNPTIQQVVNLYNLEAQKLNNFLVEQTPSTVVQTGIPSESLSQSSGVSVKW